MHFQLKCLFLIAIVGPFTKNNKGQRNVYSHNTSLCKDTVE